MDSCVGGEMNSERDLFLSAFPTILANDIQHILDTVPMITELKSSGRFIVTVCKQTICIPERIYYEEPKSVYINQLTQIQQLILHCLFTRHHDGLVREKHLNEIINYVNDQVWIIPFVIRLLGEYVLEILQVIKKNLDIISLENIKGFIKDNPDFYRLTEQRVLSYWNEYYRLQCPNKEDYLGVKILNLLRS